MKYHVETDLVDK